MNIDVNSKVTTTSSISTTTTSKSQAEESVKFSDELSNLSSKEVSEKEKVNDENNTKEKDSIENKEEKVDKKVDEKVDGKKEQKIDEKVEQKPEVNANEKSKEEITNKVDNKDRENGDKSLEETPILMDDIMDGLEDVFVAMNNKFNQPDDNIKDVENSADKNIKNEGDVLINNDVNIQEPKDLAFQMNANMNFNSDGQPFANFMNNQNDQKLSSSAKDLAEEKAILSTMSENIAMANKNRVLNEQETQNQSKVKTVSNSEGVKKVDKKTNVTVETVVKYDNIVMNEGDVDFFAKLVENGQADMTQATAKSSKVSKTLADMLAKSMKDNQPVRIDFDNNISVIIKVGRDGKISADFLPSSQVAEAYLKENLPLLRQKFEDNNIEYDELNHREQKQDEKERQKKEQKDE